MRYLVGEDLDPDYRPFGVDITDIVVYGSDLGTNITPERVMANLAEVVTGGNLEQLDCETSGYTIGQLCIADPTTRRQVMEDVNAMLDWNYGFEENATFFFRRPWTEATVPDDQLLIVSSADPFLTSWDVRGDRAQLCNRVVAYYAKKNGRAGVVTVSESDGPLGTNWATKWLDLRESCDSAADAETEATRYLGTNLWLRPTGTFTLRGDVQLANGFTIPALHVRPGMLVRNIDTDFAPQLIEHVSGRMVAREVTCTVGQRANRRDLMMARQALEAKRRRRKK